MAEQQQTGMFGRFTAPAFAGMVATAVAAFILSLFGFSDRLSSINARLDTMERNSAAKETLIRSLRDEIWDLRREIRSIRHERKPPDGPEKG